MGMYIVLHKYKHTHIQTPLKAQGPNIFQTKFYDSPFVIFIVVHLLKTSQTTYYYLFTVLFLVLIKYF